MTIIRQQKELNKPPSARTRQRGRKQITMAEQSDQGKRKFPPAVATSTLYSSGAGAAPESSSKAPRPRNFSNIEDQLLCRAYVNVSCDPISGTNQKEQLFLGYQVQV
jgi:hypothetical protein